MLTSPVFLVASSLLSKKEATASPIVMSGFPLTKKMTENISTALPDQQSAKGLDSHGNAKILHKYVSGREDSQKFSAVTTPAIKGLKCIWHRSSAGSLRQ